MAMKLYEENDIQNIANELRRYNETDNKYRVEDMTIGVRDVVDTIEEELGTTRTVEDVNSLFYEDAKEYRLIEAEYNGNVEQETTSGKNYFDISKVNDLVVSGVARLKNEGDFLTINTPSDSSSVAGSYPNKLSTYCPDLKVGDEVYLTANSTGNSKYIYLNIPKNTWSFGAKRTITQDDLDSAVYWYASGVSTTVTISEIMISKEGGDYEPYTNGPTPNPEYPQEVKTLKSWNLFDGEFEDGIYGGDNGAKLDVANYIRCKNFIPVKELTNYKFSTDSKLFNLVNVYEYKEDFSYNLTTNKNIILSNFLTTNKDTKYITFRPGASFTDKNIKVQIVEGTTEKLYLPYNSIGIKRVGKNLFDISTCVKGRLDNGVLGYASDTTSLILEKNKIIVTTKEYFRGFVSDYIKVNSSKEYYFTCNSSNLSVTNPYVVQFDSNKKFISLSSGKKTDSKWTINLANNCAYIRFSVQFSISGTFTIENPVFTDEPYQERIDYIDLQGHELLSTDKIILRDNRYWLIKNYEKIILDGQETWNWRKVTSNEERTVWSNVANTKPIDFSNDTIPVYSNYFMWNGKLAASKAINFLGIASFISETGKYIYFTVKNEIVSTSEEWRNWLSTHNTILYYPIEPQEIDLGESTLKTLKGQNNVEILATLEPTYMMEEYMLNTQSKYLPEVTTEETSIDYVAQLPLNMTIEGNVEQETTTGKNKCMPEVYPYYADATDRYATSLTPLTSPYTIPTAYRGICVVAKVEANKTYKFSSDETAGTYNNFIAIYPTKNDIVTPSKVLEKMEGSTFTPTNSGYAVIGRTSDTVGKQFTWTYAQVEEGTTATDYEPFTNGASPNPDYPQEVETLKSNREDEKIGIKRVGKNILDTSKLLVANGDNTYRGQGFSSFKIAEEIGTYTLSRKDNTMSSTAGYVSFGKGTDISTAFANKLWLCHPSSSNLNVKSETRTLNDNEELWLFLSNTDEKIQNALNVCEYLMLEKNTTASQYEPYKERIDYINLQGNELLSTDKVIVDSKGNVKLIKNWGKVVLDGSEDWVINTSGPTFYHLAFAGHIRGNAYSNYFIYKTIGSNTSDVGIYLTDSTLRTRNNISTTLTEFKQWLSEHNTEVYYQLATPIEIDLGKQLKIVPHEGINNINVEATLEPSKIKTTYYIDAKKYIEDTTSALLELGGEN